MLNGLELRIRYVMAELSHQIYGTETTETDLDNAREDVYIAGYVAYKENIGIPFLLSDRKELKKAWQDGYESAEMAEADIINERMWE